MKDTVVGFLASVLGAGGLGAWLSYKLGNRKEETSEFAIIIAEYKAMNLKLIERVSALEQKVEKMAEREIALQREITTLQSQIS